MAHDILMILVMGFPMLIFTVYPALRVGDYLEDKYNIEEGQKRIVVISTTILVTIIFSSLVYYV